MFDSSPPLPSVSGFHEGPRSFAVGLENTGLVFKAFSTCKEGDMAAAAQHLHDIMEAALVPLDKECQRLAGEHCIQVPPCELQSGTTPPCCTLTARVTAQYDGIDTSIAPATDAPLGETLVDAYEKLLGAGRCVVSSRVSLTEAGANAAPKHVANHTPACARVRFGGAGTLTVSSLITRVCKGVNVKVCVHRAWWGPRPLPMTQATCGVHDQTCGYSGLMLPPLEDRGLALRASEGKYGLQDLLLFSSVCGLGLDAVPIPGADAGGVAAQLASLTALHPPPFQEMCQSPTSDSCFLMCAVWLSA